MITVVMYHYVRDQLADSFPYVNALSVSGFESQIRYFKRHYDVVSIDEVLGKRPVSGNNRARMILTFDDGYIDHHQSVLPILKKYGVFGAFYPVVKSSRDRALLDVNKIHCLLSVDSTAKHLNRYIDSLVMQHREEFNLVSLEDYRSENFLQNRWDSVDRAYFKRMLQFALPAKFRNFAFSKLLHQFLPCSEAEVGEKMYMGVSHLRELLAEGMHVGGHSSSHIWLDKADSQMITEEVSGSFDFLDSIYGDKYIKTFCYPYGGYNARVLQVVEGLGVECAFGVTPTVWDGVTNRLAIPRFDTNDFPTGNAQGL